MKKSKKLLKKFRKFFVEYISTNRLFMSYVVFSIIITIFVRYMTVGNYGDYRPMLLDLSIILMVGALGYLIKAKNQFYYFFVWIIIYTTIAIINSVYYTFYISFASFGLLATISQVGEVTGSLYEKLRFVDFVYLLAPLTFYYIHRILNKTTYYNMVSKVERGKKMCAATLLAGVIVLAFSVISLSGTDYSRLAKQWNREYIVERFGILIYQGNDLISSLTPRINSMFGYDEAARRFRDYFTDKVNEEPAINKYTNTLEGMNVVFIHMESIQTFVMGLTAGTEEITPTINRLAKEGMYFSNFYPQVSTGTSSDTEFTLAASLMPALSGTVAVSYYDRNYTTVQKLLAEKGYYTYSAHANKAAMWNRNNLHPSLGYERFYSERDFHITDDKIINLGLNDKEFFAQLQPIMESNEEKYDNYMATLITLTNHSPFKDNDAYPQYKKIDLENISRKLNGKSEMIDLTDTSLGAYLTSVHYADEALGEFFEYVENSEYYENTVFVLYGDHDAKLSSSEYRYYYNYDPETGEMRDSKDLDYYNFDYYEQELNRKTPFIIWTKNKNVSKKINGEHDNVMGMLDVQPTLGNLMGFYNPYALGNDIHTIKEDNIVVFPNGNFLTNKGYYNYSNGSFQIIPKIKGKTQNDVSLEEDYISTHRKYTEDYLEISNDIIVHDLIYKEGIGKLESEGTET